MDNQNDPRIQELRIKIKKYLELENVSFLLGAGTSFHLGAPIIRHVKDCKGLDVVKEVKKYFANEVEPSYEDLFNCLQADIFLAKQKKGDFSKQEKSIRKMQKWLFDHCNTELTTIHETYKDDEYLKANRYFYHELLIKKILQRPINLKRVNMFTLNYDMAFDYALDNLGVHYINGFMGVHNRCFCPEVYDYDIYYPGESVSGKVHRAEKVIRYYKLHGSLSWQATTPNEKNTYGICESPISNTFNEENQLMVYPCVNKKTYTLDLPYSELFRQFSRSITQPQSVLICLGYSFYDEHINDIIKQALSIPSFTLIVANFSPSGSPKESDFSKLKSLSKKDKRVIVLEETDLNQTAFVNFVKDVMPDLYEEEEQLVIAQTMATLFPTDASEKDNKK